MCPLFLEEMEVSDTYKGLIMAGDNVFALIMLPIFGSLSDRTKSKLGKRMPYIIIGTILAAAAFPFVAVFGMNGNLIGLLIIMGLILFFMNIYRAPAVALMPDLTPKRYRSKANGIINLMGGIGGIFAYGTALLFGNKHPFIPFIITSALMIVALIILITTIKEAKLLAEIEENEEIKEEMTNLNPLSKKQKRNLIYILCAVFFWYFAVNAVETFWGTYSWDIFFNNNPDNKTTGAIALLIFTAASIASYLPGGILAQKIGRKKAILIGVTSIFSAFFIAAFFSQWNILIFVILFILAGFGWAAINASSYPMVVEYASGNNGGKFTGFYYTASQLAQTITPLIIGSVMDLIGRRMMFPYAAFFLFISFIFMMIVKEKQKNN
jgi:MFS family permease